MARRNIAAGKAKPARTSLHEKKRNWWNEEPGKDPAECGDRRGNGRAGSFGMRRWRYIVVAAFPACSGNAFHTYSENNRGKSGELVHSRPSEYPIYGDGKLQRRKHSEPDYFRQLELLGNERCDHYERRVGSRRRSGQYQDYGDFGSGERLGDPGSGRKHHYNGNFERSTGLDILNRHATRPPMSGQHEESTFRW
jgi:hypothetical protein